MIEGHATAAGTQRFAERFPALKKADHFREPKHVTGAADLLFSSIGLGTYLGEPDEAADQLYVQAVELALRSGINVLDTAINYRHQRSERNIGEAIRNAIEAGKVQRDEFIVCTKAGYLSFDGEIPEDPRSYFTREYVDTGILKPAEVAGGMHCMTPKYLENQLDRSLKNLGLATIDVFYVHNPESQLGDVPREEFRHRLKAAFSALEKAVHAGKIRFYGIASWNAFRVNDSEQGFMSLEECMKLAHEAGGEHHHFRFVQMPFNLGMPEGVIVPTQPMKHEPAPMLHAAWTHKVAVIASASLYQGQLTRNLPEWIRQTIGMETDAERALQFARSAPGILTALVGMGKPAHVLENIKAAYKPPISEKTFETLFQHQ